MKGELENDAESKMNARTELLSAAAMAGVSFQKGLGGVHGLSEPTGAVYDTQHGLTNAVLLPYFLKELAKRDATMLKEKCPEVAAFLELPMTSGGSSIT